MKNHNKGFTLVELLAVIVILAVIVLLATTVIIPMMNKSKKNAILNEARSYMKAADDSYVFDDVDVNSVECINVSDLNGEYIKKDNSNYQGVILSHYLGDKISQTIHLTNGKYYVVGTDELNLDNVFEERPEEFVNNCSDYTPSTSTNNLAYITSKVASSSYATDDPDGNFRFIGSDPNNYVYFNGQTWRIIGIFDDKLKIISPNIGLYSYDTSSSGVNGGQGVNEWSQADIMKLLNPGYDNNSEVIGDTATLVNNSLYWNRSSGSCFTDKNLVYSSCDFTNVGLTDTAKNMISDNTWYTASNVKNYSGVFNAAYAYNAERSSNNGKQCNKNLGGCKDTVTRTTSWEGKVGLLYVSDYAYATGGGTTYDRDFCIGAELRKVGGNSTLNWLKTYTECITNDWLLDTNNMFTIMPFSGGSYAFDMYGIASTGFAGEAYAYKVQGIRPVVYLKSSVSIKGGDGSSTHPFELQ